MEQVVCGNIRVQFSGAQIVRIERARGGKFCDGNTLNVPDRTVFAEGGVAYSENDGVVCFGDYELYLPDGTKGLKGLRLDMNGKTVYTYHPLKNTGELPAPDKTPAVFALADSPRVLVPAEGYTAEAATPYEIEEDAEDIYLLLAEGSAKTLRELYVSLTGRCELVRLSALGSWNSKYFVYDEQSAKQVILDYEKHNVPLDNMVIDTDWRAASDRGIGYDIDLKLFPDMARFMRFAHEHGVEIMFNDHPEPVEGASSVLDPKEIKYREEKLQSLLEVGLDTWWYDRNWHTKLISPVKGINPEALGLYLFSEVTKHYYQKRAIDKKVYRRPDLMGNVDNVMNGCYIGIDSSITHRYGTQWTGDIESDYYALSQEVYNLIECTNNCIAYVNADCGGHTGNPTKDQFIRWMQFGTLSPVFRPHCTIGLQRNREPWVFDKETEDIVRDFNNLRYRLLPVIYKHFYECYLTGVPAFRALSFEYPDDGKACARKDEYLLGKDLLVAPVGGGPLELLTDDEYVAPVKAVFYDGTECKGEPIATAEWSKLFMNLNETSPADGVPVHNFSAKFKAKLKVEIPRELFIRIDDGATVYVDGKKVLEDKTFHSPVLYALGALTAGEEHTVEIEYFQGGGGAFCALYTGKPLGKLQEKEIYLPAGKWLDAFHGKVYDGGREYAIEYQFNEAPLFIRLGALLPLAYEARNTKEQKWDKLVYDFYPEKSAITDGYLYEDDTQTTGYKLGRCRKSAFRAGYCKDCNAYVVTLRAGEGNFEGEKRFLKRRVTLKYHALDGADTVEKVTVNGQEAPFVTAKKDQRAFPLSTGNNAPDGDCILVSLETDTDQSYEVKFYLA